MHLIPAAAAAATPAIAAPIAAAVPATVGAGAAGLAAGSSLAALTPGVGTVAGLSAAAPAATAATSLAPAVGEIAAGTIAPALSTEIAALPVAQAAELAASPTMGALGGTPAAAAAETLAGTIPGAAETLTGALPEIGTGATEGLTSGLQAAQATPAVDIAAAPALEGASLSTQTGVPIGPQALNPVSDVTQIMQGAQPQGTITPQPLEAPPNLSPQQTMPSPADGVSPMTDPVTGEPFELGARTPEQIRGLSPEQISDSFYGTEPLTGDTTIQDFLEPFTPRQGPGGLQPMSGLQPPQPLQPANQFANLDPRFPDVGNLSSQNIPADLQVPGGMTDAELLEVMPHSTVEPAPVPEPLSQPQTGPKTIGERIMPNGQVEGYNAHTAFADNPVLSKHLPEPPTVTQTSNMAPTIQNPNNLPNMTLDQATGDFVPDVPTDKTVIYQPDVTAPDLTTPTTPTQQSPGTLVRYQEPLGTPPYGTPEFTPFPETQFAPTGQTPVPQLELPSPLDTIGGEVLPDGRLLNPQVPDVGPMADFAPIQNHHITDFVAGEPLQGMADPLPPQPPVEVPNMADFSVYDPNPPVGRDFLTQDFITADPSTRSGLNIPDPQFPGNGINPPGLEGYHITHPDTPAPTNIIPEQGPTQITPTDPVTPDDPTQIVQQEPKTPSTDVSDQMITEQTQIEDTLNKPFPEDTSGININVGSVDPSMLLLGAGLLGAVLQDDDGGGGGPRSDPRAVRNAQKEKFSDTEVNTPSDGYVPGQHGEFVFINNTGYNTTGPTINGVTVPLSRPTFAEGGIVNGDVPPHLIDDAMTDAVGALEGLADPSALLMLHELLGDELFDEFMEIMRMTRPGGRLIEGPGGPTDDAIPAMIDNTQPAALSDGEYVVTADAVQNIGDGDPRRGAAKLDEMMALASGGRVQKGLEALVA